MFLSIKKTIIKVAALFILLSVFSFLFLKAESIFTGILSGMAVSLLNLYMLALTLEKVSALQTPKIWSYFWRTFFLRLPAVVLVFCLLIVLLKINMAGFFLGLVTGFIIGIFKLTKLCQLSPKA
ncbi:MAG: ATP synthase subunit I [Elusimicrobia bacterium]|nr:ATP synthase subunit I [Elusimicrobiota bacterium]MBU2614976.1 ATP synthase subunit I [Elusimicrobiota bacterium]